jgi:hypothetical protein
MQIDVEMTFFLATLALGLQLKHGLTNVQAKSEHGSHISCSQECKRVWGNEPPHFSVSSHFEIGIPMDSQIFRRRL